MRACVHACLCDCEVCECLCDCVCVCVCVCGGGGGGGGGGGVTEGSYQPTVATLAQVNSIEQCTHVNCLGLSSSMCSCATPSLRSDHC